jgi:hypothetical protein
MAPAKKSLKKWGQTPFILRGREGFGAWLVLPMAGNFRFLPDF